MVRITVTGSALEGFEIGLPAGSVRFLLPTGDSGVVLPTWNGNEFLLDDGSRPVIRTLTPLRFDPALLELDVEVVVHGHGPLSAWAVDAVAGTRTAVSGPGRGYEIDPDCRSFLLLGDESALPAMSVVLPALPQDAEIKVVVEVADLEDRSELPVHPGATVEWHQKETDSVPGDSLVSAVANAELPSGARVWAAGEAAAVQRIRRHLFDKRGLQRSNAVVRGYWKHGRNQRGS